MKGRGSLWELEVEVEVEGPSGPSEVGVEVETEVAGPSVQLAVGRTVELHSPWEAVAEEE